MGWVSDNKLLLLLAAAVAALLTQYALHQFERHQLDPKPQGFVNRSCEPVLACSQMYSCEDAAWHLKNCAWGPDHLDGDGNGLACETICRIPS